jgi:small-conductance mechanosensitive channel
VSVRELIRSLPHWVIPTAFVLLAALLAFLAHWLLYAILRRAARRSRTLADNALAERTRRPSRWLLVAFVVQASMRAFLTQNDLVLGLAHFVQLVLIGSAAWLAASFLRVAEDIASHRYRTDVKDNLHARTIQTQLRVLRRLAGTTILFIAVGWMLTTFPRIQQLGTTLLASAGVIGLMIGMAARPLFANLIAGVQIALTQPIRLDDVVIVEGEWGRIEEIRSTYVVVAIWDDRRLIVPLSHFIEKPFQNWTRTRAALLGTVVLHVDYTFPVEEARVELKRILDASESWDKRAWSLQVTDAGKETMEVRFLMSAADSSAAWDLRCSVREEIISWLQKTHPECLPRRRIEGSALV